MGAVGCFCNFNGVQRDDEKNSIIFMFFSPFLILTAFVIVLGNLTATLDIKSFRRFHLPTDITDTAITNRTEVRL